MFGGQRPVAKPCPYFRSLNPNGTLEPVKTDSFCNLLQTLAISFTLKTGDRLHNPASSSQPSLPCLYLSPLRGLVKIDTFCDRLHCFATSSLTRSGSVLSGRFL